MDSPKEVTHAKKARTALGLRGRGGPERSVLVSLLRYYQLHSSEQKGLLYYKTLLNVPIEGGMRREVLRRYQNNPITGHFSACCTLKLVARKFYWLSMLRNVKAYTKACSMCQRIYLVWH
jgi:hypothetical protein